MPIRNTVCSCCGTSGDCVAHPATVCVTVSGCFTDKSGCVIQITDSHGTTQTCTTTSSGSCASCFTVTQSGTLTITLVSVPARWVMPATTTFTVAIACNGSYSQNFALTNNFPYWLCCCPGQTDAMPNTLTVTTPLGNLTLTLDVGTGFYNGCQTVPSISVADNLGFPNFCNTTVRAGSTGVRWSVAPDSIFPGFCWGLSVTAWDCQNSGASLPASSDTSCTGVFGCPSSSACGLSGTCEPVLATGTLSWNTTARTCAAYNAGGGMMLDIYGVNSWTATVTE
jgi:hypothetical protein